MARRRRTRTQKKKNCGCHGSLRLWGGNRRRRTRRGRCGGSCPFCHNPVRGAQQGGDGGYVGPTTFPFAGMTTDNTIPLNPNIGAQCDQTDPGNIANDRLV